VFVTLTKLFAAKLVSLQANKLKTKFSEVVLRWWLIVIKLNNNSKGGMKILNFGFALTFKNNPVAPANLGSP